MTETALKMILTVSYWGEILNQILALWYMALEYIICLREVG